MLARKGYWTWPHRLCGYELAFVTLYKRRSFLKDSQLESIRRGSDKQWDCIASPVLFYFCS